MPHTNDPQNEIAGLKDRNRIKIQSVADKKGLSSNYYPFAICLTWDGRKKGIGKRQKPRDNGPTHYQGLGLVQWARLNGNRRFIRITTAMLRHGDLWARRPLWALIRATFAFFIAKSIAAKFTSDR